MREGGGDGLPCMNDKTRDKMRVYMNAPSGNKQASQASHCGVFMGGQKYTSCVESTIQG